MNNRCAQFAQWRLPASSTATPGLPYLLTAGRYMPAATPAASPPSLVTGEPASSLNCRHHAIVADELQRALEDPDPLRGIAQLTARLCAAFMLDPDGVTRTKTLGSERMARKLRDALPCGESALRTSVWDLMRPMLSPALVALNRDAFVTQDESQTTVELAGRHAASSLDDLHLDELNSAAA
jgi:hypothetical protein